MPTRAPSRCTKCSQLATKAGRCDAHQVKPWETKSANSLALSGGERAKLRKQKLAVDPTCQVCGSTDVADLELDHIIEIADGGALKDSSNTWLLCTECHRIKTLQARLARAARRRRRAATTKR